MDNGTPDPLVVVARVLTPLLDKKEFSETLQRMVITNCAVEGSVLRWSITLDGSVAKGRKDFRGKDTASAQELFSRELETSRQVIRRRYAEALATLAKANVGSAFEVVASPLVDVKSFVSAVIEVRRR